MILIWETLKRPGQSGSKKQELIDIWNKEFGKDNWRIAWEWKDNFISKTEAYQLYEDSYYQDSFQRESLWLELINTAKEVYDIEEKDINSGFDYFKQEGNATHLQDISIRRVIMRRGWQFKGNELIQIRNCKDTKNKDWSKQLDPGKLKFHLPELIKKPNLEGWWDKDSVEDFYQSNKILQIRK